MLSNFGFRRLRWAICPLDLTSFRRLMYINNILSGAVFLCNLPSLSSALPFNIHVIDWTYERALIFGVVYELLGHAKPDDLSSSSGWFKAANLLLVLTGARGLVHVAIAHADGTQTPTSNVPFVSVILVLVPDANC